MSPVYDLAVIGGGIQGVGVAQAASAAGYKTIVFEQEQLAAGTSSRSSKLIHGGLRYLESAQFGLVRKALQERAILLRIAPELVRLVPFYIPIYPHTRRSGFEIRAGLSLYSALGSFSADARFRKLSSAELSQLALSDTSSLKSVYQYYDAQTDDRALTRAVMYSALKLGAELLCPARVCSIRKEPGQFLLGFDQQGTQKEVKCRVVINATGPWVNRLLSFFEPGADMMGIDLVQGTHLVLEEPAYDGIYYVEAPQDQRAVFVMPWQGKTMVGTTETSFNGEPENTLPTQTEIDYLLAVYGHYFKGNDHVVESFSGLRVLPQTDHSFFHRPRDTVLFQQKNHPGLLTLYGGKLTGYRATAQQVIKKVRPLLPDVKAIADTASLSLQPADSI